MSLHFFSKYTSLKKKKKNVFVPQPVKPYSTSKLQKHLTSVTLQMTGASFFCRSFYNWKTQVSTSNSSPNFEVIYDDPNGLLFRSKRDKKILNVDPSVGFVDAVFLTSVRQMGQFIRSVHLFNNSKNVSGNHKLVGQKKKNSSAPVLLVVPGAS